MPELGCEIANKNIRDRAGRRGCLLPLTTFYPSSADFSPENFSVISQNLVRPPLIAFVIPPGGRCPLDESATSSKTRQFLHEPTELAWHDFVDRYGTKILGWCRKRGLSREASEDITQEVLLRLHRSMRGYDRSQSFRGWLYVVTMNAITDFRTSLRSVGGQAQPEFEQFLAASEEVAEFVAARDVFSVAMERTKLRCPSRHWEVFYSREYQGLDYNTLADQTGLQVAVLMNYVSSAKKIFAEEWGKLHSDS